MKPYKTRITNPWGDAIHGQVLVGNLWRGRTSTITLRDHLRGCETNLTVDQLRTLKISLETGKDAKANGLILSWGEYGATLILGQMRLTLDEGKRTSLISRLGEIIPAEVEQDEVMLPWWR